jgi:GNAT superfamily N-acetyltransferase
MAEAIVKPDVAQEISVTEIDLLDGASGHGEAWHDAVSASKRHTYGERDDSWSLDEIRCWARGDSASRGVFLLARDRTGAVAGAAELNFPLRDNLFQAYSEIHVHPGHRRRGVGTTLIEALTARVLADGRTTLVVEGARRVDGPDVMTPFAARHGFTAALAGGRNDLDLPIGEDQRVDLEALDATVLAPLDVEVAAADPGSTYHLLTYWDRIPDEYVDARAVLAARMSTDAPMDDLTLEPEDWDGARVQEVQEIIRAQQRRRVETIAVHTATNTLVGATDIVVGPSRPEVASQWDTLVLDEHRGRRLGMWLKAANLRALVAGWPQVHRVTTYNAGSNAAMLRVNHAMGFRQVGITTEWQKVLTG